jgi:hypothetical protein
MKDRGAAVSADHCEELRGVWHVATDGNMPITIAGYNKAYDFIKAELLKGGGTVDSDAYASLGRFQTLIMGTLEGLSPHCPWGSDSEYSDRMRDVQGSVERIYGQVVTELQGGPG